LGSIGVGGVPGVLGVLSASGPAAGRVSVATVALALSLPRASVGDAGWSVDGHGTRCPVRLHGGVDLDRSIDVAAACGQQGEEQRASYV
jgi:hypothetical protein